MPAKFGTILSDLEGAANQILKVNSGGTAFEMATPPALPSYTVTNDTVDRVIDANDVTLDEVADVLATLIKDMADIYSGGLGPFQWSTSEQVYPFEKGLSGETLYCKHIDVGALPNTGVKDVAHNIVGLLPANIISIIGKCANPSLNAYPLPFAYPGGSGGIDVMIAADSTYVSVRTGVDFSAYSGFIRLIYSK